MDFGVERFYEFLLTSWPYSERLFFTFYFTVVHNTVFWGLCSMFLFIQYFKIFEKYRIKRTEKLMEINWELTKTCLRQLFITHFIVQWFVGIVFYDIFVYFGTKFTAPIPSPLQIACEIFFCFVINDFAFYWAHRALHHPLLYARIHKQHHQFVASIGFAAEYATPLEGLLANTIPTLLGCFIFGSHFFTILVYFILRIWETVESHSGYDFPWSVWSLFDWQGGAAAHDFHHSHNIGNFGGVCFSFWDSLMGTNVAYLKHLQSQSESTSPDTKDKSS